MPFIRNNLVLLFSKQTDESLETQVGKENLRQAALDEVRKVLEQENGSSGVLDLYFNNFILQK
jgi:flagellar FliL protein